MSELDQLRGKAMALHGAGRLDEAAAAYVLVLASFPDDTETLSLLGALCGQQGKLEQAAVHLAKAVALDEKNVLTRVNLGRARRGLGQVTEALNEFDKALAIDPSSAEALFAKATTLLDQGRFEESIDVYDKLVALQPKHASAWLARGNALLSIGNTEAALSSYQKARQSNPTIADHHLNEGQALLALGRYQPAREAFDKAVQIDPNLLNAHLGRASALMKLHNVIGALVSAEKARQIQPDSATAYCLLGCGQFELGHFENAVTFLSHATQLQSNYAEAHFALGEALQRLGRSKEAAESFARVVDLKPNMDLAIGNMLTARMQECDWLDFEALSNHVVTRVRAGQAACHPLTIQAFCDDGSLLRRCAEIVAGKYHPPGTRNITRARFRQSGKIRVGYLTGQFSDPTFVSVFLPIINNHDRSAFELIGIDSGFDDGSDMRKQIKASFNGRLSVTDLSDMDAALRIAAMELDLLIDLGGFSGNARPNILAQRPVALQAGFLWPNSTSGTNYMDYLITDKYSVSTSNHSNFSEQLIRLAISPQAIIEPQKTPPSTGKTRADFALPENDIVFVFHGDAQTITPSVFSSWMTLLADNPESVLWFTRATESMSRNLSMTAEKSGVSPTRLIFMADEASMRNPPLWLADIGLDSSPFGSHFNAAELLAAKTPIVTLQGNTPPSRKTASLMQFVGLPDLIAADQSQYVKIAQMLASNRSALSAVREKLEELASVAGQRNKDITSAIEQAIRYMVNRHEAGKIPAAADLS